MCEIYTQRYWERDCKMLIRLSDKCVCVCDTGGVITQGSEVKIVPFPISSGPSIDLFSQHTTPILCLLRMRIPTPRVLSADCICMLYRGCWVFTVFIQTVWCVSNVRCTFHILYTWRESTHTNILLRVITRHLCIAHAYTIELQSNFSPKKAIC